MSKKAPQEYLYIREGSKKKLKDLSDKLGIPIIRIVEIVFDKLTLKDIRRFYDEELES